MNYHRLRFQIEFNFHDAKQFWGLEDFMAVKPTTVTNAARLAFFMVNLSHCLLHTFRRQHPQASILDLKTYAHREPTLTRHRARLSFGVAFLIALIQVKTVNFSELAAAFGGKAQIDSPYKRLQRFSWDFEIGSAVLTQTVVGLLKIGRYS